MSFTAIITADAKGFEMAIDQAQSKIDGLEKTVGQRLSSIGDKFTDIGRKASVLSAAIVAAGGASFKMAADFQDALGATDQVYKQSSDTVKEWAQNLSSQYGIAKSEALSYSNMMGSMLVNIGQLTEEQAAKQSQKLIELAGDLTAMYGGRVQDAVIALTGALKGNNTMLDNYGMAVNDALVKTRALELGLIAQGEEMTLAARQAATLSLIWEQSAAAQGQAAREADGASGAMRALSVEVKNLSTEIGEVLLPIITPIVAKIRDFVSGLRELSPEMLRIGVVIAGVVAALGPLLVLLGKILQMLPLIKVAIMELTGPIGIVSAAVVVMAINFHKNIEAMRTDWDFFTEHLKTTSAAFGDVLNGNFSGWWDKVRTTFDKNIDYIQKKWQQLKEYFTGKGDVGSAGETGMMLGGIGDEEAAAAARKAAEEAVTAARKAAEEETAAAKKIADESINVSDTFTKLIGTNLSLQDSIRKTSDTIDELQSKLIKLQTGIISSTNVRDEIKTTKQQINDLSEALNLLTGGRELDLKVNAEMPTIAADMNKFFDGKNWTLPAIDSSLLQTSLAKAGEMVIDYGRYIEGGIVDVVSAIGSAWGSGDWSNLGKDMLSAVGKLAQQFGAMVIGFAIAADALKKIITTHPIAAIAAGAALIALGAAAQAAAGKMMNNAFSGSSGGYDRSYSGGTSSYQQATPSYAPTEFRGPYQDNYTVEFKIGTNELVGVLDMAEQKKRRL